MKLRVRLGLTALAALVPLLLGAIAVVRSSRVQSFEAGLVATAQANATAGRAACEAAPERWGGPMDLPAHGPPSLIAGADLYAYDLELRSAHPDAPALPTEVIAAARAGESRVRHVEERFGVLVRTAEAGPCAYTLIRGVMETPRVSPLRGTPWVLTGLLFSLLLLGVVLALLGPIVRRIHRLRDEVRAAAASNYQQGVTTRGDDELAELARAFDETRRQLSHHLEAQARRERTLREFLANTTHDVMVPLTVLQGHLAALQGGGDAAALRAAMQEADYIAALVHNLEVAARLDAGEPELVRAPAPLAPLVVRVIQRHLPLARRREVELVHAVPRAPIVVLGDLTLIERALGNLVHNALMHNRAGGHVAVVLEMDDEECFRVLVKDDGPGLDAEELTRVLERGERGEAARTRHPHGKGLGLAITRRVAAAHGWGFCMRNGEEGGLEVELRGAVVGAAP
ncbi:MAG: HAMP domain-containing histidine kinase [Myxococcales bacterium]|nr:HAMP domain-containing histidine kinase [Myxococcales bacterium]